MPNRSDKRKQMHVAKAKPVSVIGSDVGTKIPITDVESQEMADLEGNMNRLKVALGDIAMEEQMVHQRKLQVMQACADAQAAYVDRGKRVARAHNVDINDTPDGGTWTIDHASKLLVRVKLAVHGPDPAPQERRESPQSAFFNR